MVSLTVWFGASPVVGRLVVEQILGWSTLVSQHWIGSWILKKIWTRGYKNISFTFPLPQQKDLTTKSSHPSSFSLSSSSECVGGSPLHIYTVVIDRTLTHVLS